MTNLFLFWFFFYLKMNQIYIKHDIIKYYNIDAWL